MSNTRTVTAVVAFVVAFIFSAGLVRIIFPTPVVEYTYTYRPAYVNRSSNELERFLLRDINNGDVRNDYRYSGDYASAVKNYWEASSNMDASRFPQDFQDAWREHMQAWGNYAEFLEAKKSARNNSMCNLDRRYVADINSTWQKVLRIGRTYGAYVE